MLQIRRNCFETNSSSTHSLVMCENDDYEALKNNEAFLVGDMYYSPTIVKKENLLEALNKDDRGCYKKMWEKYCIKADLNPESLDDFVNEVINGFNKANTDLKYEFYTLDQMWENSELEVFENTYTTKDKQTIHAFGCHGYLG